MIWAISDLHFDPTGEKPMDIFGSNWSNHENKIIVDWKDKVNEDDLVLLGGDISWALKLEDAYDDLKLIDDLPGCKAMIKGNHDYWWGTKSKLMKLNLSSIEFIYNSHLIYKDFIIYGTRGWEPKDTIGFDENDEKIYNRELNRLKMSFESFKGDRSKRTNIAMIHYPPFNSNGSPNEFLDIMKEYDMSVCIYGHLHGPGLANVKEGNIGGIDVRCTSSDYQDFKLSRIF